MDTREKKRQGRTPSGAANRKRRPAARTEEKNRERRPQPSQSPDVVYTQPGPFNRDRFFLYLLSAVAVVLALVFGMSIFFKVEKDKCTVSGTQKYTAYDVWQASGIQDGENLLTLRKSEIGSKIMRELPYVTQVRIRIKLPDTVNIEIVEANVVYSAEAANGTWWLLRADGKVVEKTNAADAGQFTKILGVRIADPKVGEAAVAEEPQPQQDPETGAMIPVTVLGSERLALVVSMLGLLEDNGIIGSAASVDVSNMSDLQLWYGDRYQVKLGNNDNLAYKISMMKAAIDSGKEYDRGILDVSFTVEIGGSKDKVIYTPFE